MDGDNNVGTSDEMIYVYKKGRKELKLGRNPTKYNYYQIKRYTNNNESGNKIRYIIQNVMNSTSKIIKKTFHYFSVPSLYTILT